MAKVFVSPSTQDWNRYAGGGNEEEWMRKVSAVTVDVLEAAGHTVKMGGKISAKTNAEAANKWGADWYVAVHSNAGGGHGSECWYFTGSKKSLALAKAVYARVSKVSNMPDRGIKGSKAYIELHVPNAPATIVEVAFHDNKKEAAEIRADYKEFGTAIAKGVIDLIGGEKPKPKPKPEPKPSGGWTKGTTLVVTPDKGANLRRSPSIKSRVIRALPKGTRVVCQTWGKDWTKVRHKTTIGYIATRLLRKV